MTNVEKIVQIRDGLPPISPSPEEDSIRSWLNIYLGSASPPLIIDDLTEELIRNGVALGLLLEILGNVELNGLLRRPITRVERLHNVHEVFTLLRKLKVRLDNIQPEDILRGDKDSIVQLLAAISNHFKRYPAESSGLYSSSTSTSRRLSPMDRLTSHDRSFSVTRDNNIASIAEKFAAQLKGPVYKHPVIGPNSLRNGQKTPRSRSTLTLKLDSLQSSTPAPTVDSKLSFPTVIPVVNAPLKQTKESCTLNDGKNPRFQENLHYFAESLDDLSLLRTRLENISQLLSSETPILPTCSPVCNKQSTKTVLSSDTTEPPTSPPATNGQSVKIVQTDLVLSSPDKDRELMRAEREIRVLSSLLKTKDDLLRHSEAENRRLIRALQTIQDEVCQRIERQRTRKLSEQQLKPFTHTTDPVVRSRSAGGHLPKEIRRYPDRGVSPSPRSLTLPREYPYFMVDPYGNSFGGVSRLLSPVNYNAFSTVSQVKKHRVRRIFKNESLDRNQRRDKTKVQF
ncbi:unnamed protein product [Calicophoron daubneyi]|uniref:Calponin-homology (CH) domain-containing protein n=1 Tax=Calicophoron daubneyi TaxID=300641 RepID=A0AAV2TD25_CALDB